MDVMQMVTGAVTPALAGKVARALGLPEALVSKALTLGIPVVLAAVLKRGSTAGGADAVGSALASFGKDPMGGLTAAMNGDGTQVQAAAQGGSDLLGSLFGVGAAGSVAKALAGYVGVDEKAAAPLLGLAGTAALGGLKSTADQRGLDTAGVLKMLGSEQGAIAKAIPPDLSRMLSATGLLPDMPAAAAAAPRVSAPPPTPPAPATGGMGKWIIGAVILLALLWLLWHLFGGSPAPTTATAPATTTTTTTSSGSMMSADPLVVNGVNLGDQIKGALTGLTTTLGGVTDAATAQAALPDLTKAATTLDTVQAAVPNLPAQGKTALAALINAAMPTLKATIDKLMADSAIGPVLKPVVDPIVAKLTAMAG